MMKRIFLFLLMAAAIAACSDNDSFTTSTSARLTFSADTVKMDTVFSTIGSSTYTFWVYNQGDDGIRLQSVRLGQGNQTGFRVNVDGSYLDNSTGAVAVGLEVRGGDSLRVFVELTAPENMQQEAQLVEDDLLFQLESGVVQRVHLEACAWDAIQWTGKVLRRDTVIESSKPIIVYGGLRIDSAATVTIRHTTLYFHDQAGIDVYGTLLTDSVLMRGDRLDHMFDYLPYDRVSGQWRGVTIHSSSFHNELVATEIRNAENALVCDSAALSADRQRLYMERCVIHNSKGAGLEVNSSYVGLLDCQFSNTLGDCLAVYGGIVVMQGCTLAQFYPFSADRGVALRLCNYKGEAPCALEYFKCSNSIVTGYADDVVMGGTLQGDSITPFVFLFENSLLRTPVVEDDTVSYVRILWESPSDSIQGKKHFVLVDEQNLKYDFHLDSLSTAQGLGCYR
ncbi:MAG: right-handed parallel beta-helix repeat-containing protein [Prevotella sp.]|nr:right-handed parallel beta-helix repeat-containing protein [Prevotella sp.]